VVISRLGSNVLRTTPSRARALNNAAFPFIRWIWQQCSDAAARRAHRACYTFFGCAGDGLYFCIALAGRGLRISSSIGGYSAFARSMAYLLPCIIPTNMYFAPRAPLPEALTPAAYIRILNIITSYPCLYNATVIMPRP